MARRNYIEAVRLFNTEIKTIPGRWWNALMYQAEPMANFSVAEEITKAPTVDFNPAPAPSQAPAAPGADAAAPGTAPPAPAPAPAAPAPAPAN